jgi:DNA-binding response OmpR family regulator
MAENAVKPARILVVEDELFVQGMLEDFLRRQGHQPITVATAEEAFVALREQNIRLVVLDKNLPDMSGVEVLSQIRFEDPSLPVIFMTGYPTERSKLMVKHLGISEYFEKPVDLEVLGTAIIEALATTPDAAPAGSVSRPIAVQSATGTPVPGAVLGAAPGATDEAPVPQVLLATPSSQVVDAVSESESAEVRLVAVASSVDAAYDYLQRQSAEVLAVDFSFPSGTAPALVRWATEKDPTMSVLAVVPPLNDREDIRHVVEALELRYWVETPIERPDELVSKLEILLKRASTLRAFATD